MLILERGGNAPLKESIRATASILNAVRVNDDLLAARAFTSGGTTAVYFAVADAPPLDTFRSFGIDISRELEETQRELPLAVLPDALLGAQALRVRDSALELGYAWKKNTMLVDLSKCPSGYAYEAKWNARSYLQDALDNGATLINGARVVKVLLDQQRAVGVEYKLQKSKKVFDTCQAFGAKVILAAGGAASPIILRNSGMKHVATSGFYCHPGFAVCGMVPGLKAGENFVGSMGTEVDKHIELSDGNCGRTFYRMFMLSQRKFIRAFCYSRSIAVGVLVKDGLDGTLQENNRYFKQLTSEDRRRLEQGEQLARHIIRNAGGKHVFTSSLSAAHVGGTIRLNEHLDRHLQTEYANLHVCDGSVIPESVKSTPALTLICLGKYLANHLSQPGGEYGN